MIESYLPRWSWRFLPKRVQKRLAIASIRDHMLFFGYDLEAVTDEELEERLVEGMKLLARAMPTVREAAEACSSLARAMSEAGLTEADILIGPGGRPHEDQDHERG